MRTAASGHIRTLDVSFTMKRIVIRLLSLLGFAAVTGCDEGSLDMYGCPSATFEIKGKVFDDAETPVEGIRVFASEHSDTTGYAVRSKSVFTSKDGEYEVVLNTIPVRKVYLFATDVDGEANGGEFASRSIEVDFTDAKFEGGDGWYSGKATETVDIRLDRAEK